MKNKIVPIFLVLSVTIGFSGCGSATTSVANGNVVEDTETIVDSNTETTTETEIKDRAVAEADKPAESTASSTAEPSATEPTSSPTEKPQATATPEPTPTPHIHDFKVESSVPASCTAEGQVVKVCNCGEKQVEAIPMVEHSWEETTNVIRHEALGHVAQVQVGTTDKRTEYACGYCGARFDSVEAETEHCLAYLDNIEHALCSTIMYDYPGEPIYENQWVVDQEAWDETITNYKCFVCGATK